jgi:hypothetical protein
VRELGLRHADLTEAAIDQAVDMANAKGWMLGEGRPAHSVCLTDVGRHTK